MDKELTLRTFLLSSKGLIDHVILQSNFNSHLLVLTNLELPVSVLRSSPQDQTKWNTYCTCSSLVPGRPQGNSQQMNSNTLLALADVWWEMYNNMCENQRQVC